MCKEKRDSSLKAVFLWSFCVLFLMAGCGGNKPKFTEEELSQIPFAQRQGLPEVSGGFVLSVKGETITSDKIIQILIDDVGPVAQKTDYERFRREAGPLVRQVVVNEISNILLYQEAKRDAGDNIEDALDKAVEAEASRFVVGFGGDIAKAEQVLKERGMDWDSFKDYQRKMILSQSYISSNLPKESPVTYSELMSAYNEMKDEFFTTPGVFRFQLIDIEVAKVEVADANNGRLESAKDMANNFVRRIRAGEDFGQLAKQYSHGHRRMFGGMWKPVQPGSLAEPYDVLAVKASDMKAGQISEPIEAGGHIFVMKLLEYRAEVVEPFEKVQKEVEAKLIFERRKEAVDKFSKKIVRLAALDENYGFVDFCIREIYRISTQQDILIVTEE